MYRIPRDLDLSKVIGEFTTQICIGAYDIQFSLGDVHFAIHSEIKLAKNEKQVAIWEEGGWPSSEFYKILNVVVDSYDIPNDREIVINFRNGYSLHIYDNSDQYESMQISIKGEKYVVII
jgi:hypothetical protein